jgi:coenzyme F420-reducing hydrogenase alpha subunit
MTEAPRGLIFHRYRIAANGQIEDAKIVPPTSQNQRSIEEDLRKYVETNVNLPKKELTWGCEQTVRNYDPCISCAAHFLEVKFEEQL